MISVKEQQQNAEEDDGSFTPSSNALGDRLRSDPKQRTPDENFTPSVSRTEQTESVGRLIASGQQYIGRFSDLAKNFQPKNNDTRHLHGHNQLRQHCAATCTLFDEGDIHLRKQPLGCRIFRDPFSSLSKRADTFVDNQKICAKSKSIRAMMAVKKRKQNANEDSCAPVAFLENSGQQLETRPKSANFR